MLGMGPLAASPLGALPGSSELPDWLGETLTFHAMQSGIAASPLYDVLQMSDASAAEVINVLMDRLRMTGTVLPSLNLRAQLTDEVRYEEALAFGWFLALQEGVNFAATAAAHKTTLAVLADVLHATGAVNVTTDARAILTSVLALDAMLAAQWKAELIDTVEFQDALQAQIAIAAKLVDTANFSGIAGPALRLVALCSDAIDFGDEATPHLDLLGRLQDEVLFYAVLRLDDAEYTAWTLNENAAATEYRNYRFNGLLEFDGRYYGTNDTGLYELSGTTDDGEDITWSIKTGVMDFLTGKLKRNPDCYIRFAGGGSVKLKVIVEGDDGERHMHIYNAVLRQGSALHGDRIKIGRRLDAVYWQFELEGSGKYEQDEMGWRPLIIDRRIR